MSERTAACCSAVLAGLCHGTGRRLVFVSERRAFSQIAILTDLGSTAGCLRKIVSVRGSAFDSANSAVRGRRAGRILHKMSLERTSLHVASGAFYRGGAGCVTLKNIAVSESLRFDVTAVLTLSGLCAGRGTVRMT